jgi:radical SAM superfamily enzyme YgiQ (UPF0313 family)
MKLLLIYPNSQYETINYSCEPHLGLLVLYSILPEYLKNDTKLLDGSIIEKEDIVKEIIENKPSVVGISCNSFNYGNALELCRVAKSVGAKTILGGIHITNAYQSILRNISVRAQEIDYLYIGNLRNSFRSFIENLANEQQTGICNGLIELNNWNGCFQVKFPENDFFLGPIDYSVVDHANYSSRFERSGNLINYKKIGSTYTQIGCPQNVLNRRCSFCSVPQKHFYRSFNNIIQDISTLINDHAIDHIRITDPDFLTNLSRLDELCQFIDERKKALKSNPSFYCFTRADNINENIEIIKRLNIVSTFIGYESGSNQMLKRYNKNITAAKSIQATKLLQKHNVDVTLGSFVIGGMKENAVTLQETLDFVKKLSKIGNVRKILISPMIPYPGSSVFTRLLSVLKRKDETTFERIFNTDDLDLNEMIELWNNYFTDVEVDDLRETIKQAHEIIPMGMQYLSV